MVRSTFLLMPGNLAGSPQGIHQWTRSTRRRLRHRQNSRPVSALSSSGRLRLDYVAVARLAFPFMLNSAVQAVLNATDTWFVGPAVARGDLGDGRSVLAGAGLDPAVRRRGFVRADARWPRPTARSATRAPRRPRGPLFGPRCSPCRCSPRSRASGRGHVLAVRHCRRPRWISRSRYWFPRMLGAPLGIALYAVLGFFNGIGRPDHHAARHAGRGDDQCGCSTSCSSSDSGSASPAPLGRPARRSSSGLIAALAWLSRRPDPPALPLASDLRRFAPAGAASRRFQLGFPMGLLFAADILGFALFQLMQVRLGNVDGASTQIVLDAHLLLLHARRGNRHGGHDPRGAGDRRRRLRTGRTRSATASSSSPSSTWA